MNPTLAIAAAAGVACSWVAALVAVRRSRAHREIVEAEQAALAGRLQAESARAASLAAGEREAAWASQTLSGTVRRHLDELTEVRHDLEVAGRQAAASEHELDSLRDELRTTAGELASARRDLDAEAVRVAQLESAIAALAATASTGPADSLEPRLAALEAELIDTRRSVAAHAAEARDLRHRLAVAERVATVIPARVLPPAPPEAAPLGAEVDLRRRITGLEAELANLTAERDAAASGASADHDAIAGMRLELEAARAASASARSDRDALAVTVAGLRARLDEAGREIARLREEGAGIRAEADRLRSMADDARRDADRRIAAAGARLGQLEAAARIGDHDARIILTRDATITDLEQRLAALSAARDAELRSLGDKIASMEHLYVDLELRDRQITRLEDDLKQTAESRDEALGELVRLERQTAEIRLAATRAEASLDRFQGIERDLVVARTRIAQLEDQVAGVGLAAEVARLRQSVDAERDRADRAVQRAALIESTPSTYAEFDARLRERVGAAVASAVEGLEARLARLREVVGEKERRIAELSAGARPTSGPDDLTRIRGIGPKIAAILHGLGVTTFRDIASFTYHDVERVGAHLPIYGGRIVDDRWIEQAQDLAG